MAWTASQTITLGNATKKSEMDAAFNNGLFISTNAMPAATKAWFYQNTAPVGWTIDATPADALLAVKGGTQAYNANGGTQVGTWTQPNHDHTYNTVIAHTHALTVSNSITAPLELVAAGVTGAGTTLNTGSTGSASGTVSAAATAATWRPLAQVGIICTKDAYA